MTLNGNTGEFIRWALGLILAATVAYFTAIGTLQAQIAVITERELNHYAEIMQRLGRIEAKLDAR